MEDHAMITRIVVLVMTLFLFAGTAYAVDSDGIQRSDVSKHDLSTIPASDSIPSDTADQQSAWSNWNISAGGYCQLQYNNNVMEQNTGGNVNFMSKRLRPFFNAWYKDDFGVYTQSQVGHPTLLLQLFADFPISMPTTDSSLIRVGQFANSLMYIEPPLN